MIEIIAFVLIIAIVLWSGAREHRQQLTPAQEPEDHLERLARSYRMALHNYNIGQVKVAENQVRLALDYARSCKVLDLPVAAELWNLRGCILHSRQQLRAALRCYESAASIMSKWCFRDPMDSVLESAGIINDNVRLCKEQLG